MARYYAATADPATGLYRAGYSSDGTHPSQAGAKAMGGALSTLMQSLIPADWLPLATANVGATTLVPNPLFLDDNGGAPPWPTGWGAVTTNAAGASSFTTPAGTVGRRWTITRPPGADNFVNSTPDFTLAPGDRVLFAMRLSSDVEAVAGRTDVYMFDTAGRARFGVELTADIPEGSALAWEWVVPAGLPDYTLHLHLRALTGDGAALNVEQITTVNLTDVGAA